MKASIEFKAETDLGFKLLCLLGIAAGLFYLGWVTI